MYPRDAKLILQVHDELVFHVKEEVLESFIQDLEKTMTSVVSFSVPLKVDINYGDNYVDAK
jgi:DNA polymerase-1